jgi:hypothetical protein
LNENAPSTRVDDDGDRLGSRGGQSHREVDYDRPRGTSRGRTTCFISASKAQDLPNVCICCGAEAVTTYEKTFRWSPGSSKFFTFLLACLSVIRFGSGTSIAVRVPFCRSHKGYWTRRILLLLAGVVPFVIAGLLGAFDEQRMRREEVEPRLLVLPFLFLGWLITLVVVNYLSIRATEINERGVTLTNVAPKFADAVDYRSSR